MHTQQASVHTRKISTVFDDDVGTQHLAALAASSAVSVDAPPKGLCLFSTAEKLAAGLSRI